ncbi:MAG TPA: flagellar basal body rod protein FlgB [Acidobacteriaceae bacterium]|nr:flagellar basal body rod protein FlgB [Acidobacteriaceae bacterium]
MQITTPLSDELGRYLNLSGLELKLTAQNMANVDVPGYRTVGFDFAEAMKQQMGAALAARDGGAGGAAGLNGLDGVDVVKVDGLVERPDGNNVSMDREGMKMAEAQLKFRVGEELLKHQFSRVMDAIHEDK